MRWAYFVCLDRLPRYRLSRIFTTLVPNKISPALKMSTQWHRFSNSTSENFRSQSSHMSIMTATAKPLKVGCMHRNSVCMPIRTYIHVCTTVNWYILGLNHTILNGVNDPGLSVYFGKEDARGTSPEAEGLDLLKRLLIQLPRENFNVLKYLRYLQCDHALCHGLIWCIVINVIHHHSLCSRFLHEVEECSSENRMNIVNLGTIFGPHLLSPHTDDPQVLMECNNISTNFVRAMIMHHSDLFPLTNDESAPRRLSIIFQPANTPPWLQAEQEVDMLSRLGGQRSLYQPKSPLLSKQRQNTAPSGSKGRCT